MSREGKGEQASGEENEEARSLLPSGSTVGDEEQVAPGPEPRTPRTTNRVRFHIDEAPAESESGRASLSDTEWVEEEDFLVSRARNAPTDATGHRAPLLTGIEAPGVTTGSTDLDLRVEELLGNARPKSGMSSAFMNMANSIMYD